MQQLSFNGVADSAIPMVDKHYTEDWAKAKARGLLKKTLEETVLVHKRPQHVKAILLPGMDAQEIYEVFDPLNILRENLTCIERDEGVYEALEAKKLGVRLVHGSIEDYVLGQQTISADCVSVDLTSPINLEHLRMIWNLTRRQTRNSFVFHMANLLRRDNTSTTLYALGYSAKAFTEYMGDCILDGNIESAMKRYVRDVRIVESKRAEGKQINDEKSTAHTNNIIHCYMGGTHGSLNQLFKFASGDAFSSVISTITEIFTMVQPGFSEQDVLAETRSPMISRFLELLTLNLVSHYLKTKAGITNNFQIRMISSALLAATQDQKLWVPLQVTPYSYISESGSPMIGDIHVISYNQKIHTHAIRLAQALGYPTKLRIKSRQHLVSAIEAYEQAYENTTVFGSLSHAIRAGDRRQFLGNSAKPVATKQRVIAEFQAGKSVDDVKKTYRNWSNLPLPQWKAHVTMGTYNPKHTELIEGPELEPGLEAITKQEITDMLAAGFPSNAVAAAYPQYTIGQIRAYKAWITIRNKRNNGSNGHS